VAALQRQALLLLGKVLHNGPLLAAAAGAGGVKPGGALAASITTGSSSSSSTNSWATAVAAGQQLVLQPLTHLVTHLVTTCCTGLTADSAQKLAAAVAAGRHPDTQLVTQGCAAVAALNTLSDLGNLCLDSLDMLPLVTSAMRSAAGGSPGADALGVSPSDMSDATAWVEKGLVQWKALRRAAAAATAAAATGAVQKCTAAAAAVTAVGAQGASIAPYRVLCWSGKMDLQATDWSDTVSIQSLLHRQLLQGSQHSTTSPAAAAAAGKTGGGSSAAAGVPWACLEPAAIQEHLRAALDAGVCCW
jgi:hypothetical protein